MPNPVLIHTESTKLRHYLGLVDLYIRLGKPDIYEVEPKFDEEYQPDAYTRIEGEPIIVEFQRTHTSNKRMQEKVDGFVRTFKEKKHDATVLLLVSDERYKVDAPLGFEIRKMTIN